MSDFDLNGYLEQLSSSTDIDKCTKVPIPEIAKDQNYLFISYSHKDYKAVYADLAQLYCRGVRFWYDKGLRAGKEWEREVEEHIKDPKCCGVIFYLSTNMFLSTSVLKEIEFTKTRKRTSIIQQKNYFCVNLHDGNITDMLFKAQTIQQSRGLPLLDTNAVNTLTSTFSDNATYIKFNSENHIDELIEQIQMQFDVTGNDGPSNELDIGAIKNPRIALFAFTAHETDPIPLFKFLRSDFKTNRTSRPWYLIPMGVLVGLLVCAYMIYYLCTMPDVPMLTDMISAYGATYTTVGFIIFSALSSCFLVPYLTAKVFWLFYISPVKKRREEGTPSRVLLCVLYFALSAILAMFAVPLCLVILYISYLIVDYIKPFFEKLEK